MNKWKVKKDFWYRVYDRESRCFLTDWIIADTMPPDRFLSKEALDLIKAGKWGFLYKDDLECSKCGSVGWQFHSGARYCPMCGALMNEEV